MSKNRESRNTPPSSSGDSSFQPESPEGISSAFQETSALLELNDLADQIGGFIEYWGFKEIHGRIWTHLYTSKTPLDATTLTRRLKVSKALVSFAVHDLLEHNVIEEVSKGPRGTVLYRANPNLLGVILSVLRTRERRMLARIHSAHRLLANLPQKTLDGGGLAIDRIKHVGELIETAEGALDAFIGLNAMGGLPITNTHLSEDEKRTALAEQLKALNLSRG